MSRRAQRAAWACVAVGRESYIRRVPDVTRRPDATQRREALKEVWSEARGCTRCPQLAAARHTVVFGAGNADADLMFVGEAPGANEDRLGLPFVGQAGALLERLLGEIGMRRDDVFIANVLKCRPPGNRDPLPQEIDNCQEYLFRQLELVRPRVLCTLGNFATKLLRADPATGITRLHGRDEERVIGPLAVRLYPLLHPAAALYTPAMLAGLRADFQRIPELLQRARPASSVSPANPAVTHPEPAATAARPGLPVAREPGEPASRRGARSERVEPVDDSAAGTVGQAAPAPLRGPSSDPDADPVADDEPAVGAPMQLGLF